MCAAKFEDIAVNCPLFALKLCGTNCTGKVLSSMYNDHLIEQTKNAYVTSMLIKSVDREDLAEITNKAEIRKDTSQCPLHTINCCHTTCDGLITGDVGQLALHLSEMGKDITVVKKLLSKINIQQASQNLKSPTPTTPNKLKFGISSSTIIPGTPSSSSKAGRPLNSLSSPSRVRSTIVHNESKLTPPSSPSKKTRSESTSSTPSTTRVGVSQQSSSNATDSHNQTQSDAAEDVRYKSPPPSRPVGDNLLCTPTIHTNKSRPNNSKSMIVSPPLFTSQALFGIDNTNASSSTSSRRQHIGNDIVNEDINDLGSNSDDSDTYSLIIDDERNESVVGIVYNESKEELGTSSSMQSPSRIRTIPTISTPTTTTQQQAVQTPRTPIQQQRGSSSHVATFSSPRSCSRGQRNLDLHRQQTGGRPTTSLTTPRKRKTSSAILDTLYRADEKSTASTPKVFPLFK